MKNRKKRKQQPPRAEVCLPSSAAQVGGAVPCSPCRVKSEPLAPQRLSCPAQPICAPASQPLTMADKMLFNAPLITDVSETPPETPRGLQYLSQIDQLIVNGHMDPLEVLVGFESDKVYQMRNSLGEPVFYALEDTECCTRNTFGSLRPFCIKVIDIYRCEVIRLTRPLNCGYCCFPCCLQELEVQVPPGNPAGYVVQEWHPYLPRFVIQNERKEPLLKISGPFWTCGCFSDVPYEVTSLDENTVVGRISKEWSGITQECCTDADNFRIQFPMDLDVKVKAALIGACFLIDFMYSEK
ncbi:phospholipid scramblase 1-like isoform X2 [Arapaima gigas]